MKEFEGREKITWEEWLRSGSSIGNNLTNEELAELDRLYSLLDLTSIPDDVGFPDKEFQAKVDAAKAEKARQESR